MKTTTPVNAGSMADIAFLMLIFFLTTTTIQTDSGISERLPDKCPSVDCSTPVTAQNTIDIQVNSSGEILIEEQPIALAQAKKLIKKYILNTTNSNTMPTAPDKAVIAVKIARELNYSDYIAIKDVIEGTYAELRADFAMRKFGKKIETLSPKQKKEVIKNFPKKVVESNY